MGNDWTLPYSVDSCLGRVSLVRIAFHCYAISSSKHIWMRCRLQEIIHTIKTLQNIYVACGCYLLGLGSSCPNSNITRNKTTIFQINTFRSDLSNSTICFNFDIFFFQESSYLISCLLCLVMYRFIMSAN